VDDTELFRREADIALLDLDLTAATYWESESTVRMARLAEGVAGPRACAGATRFTDYVSDGELRVGAQLCVRTTRGRLALADSAEEPPVLVLSVA
jgi:hypothetical protein